uniref:C2H2-type domain-containing protein n=1 Tax=Anopheles maculatus TaxID=74869 RepID=A0A182STJ6_9DIPT
MDGKAEYISSDVVDAEMCRICVTESVGQCCMDEEVDAERCLSLNTMLKTMFPTTFGQEAKPVEGMNWPTKACLVCKEKVLVAYELYAQLVDSEEWLQRYAEERSTIEVETVKSEQDCSSGVQYDVLIEYTFEDGNAVYTEEAEHLMDETDGDALSETKPIAEEETAKDETATRRSTRKRNNAQMGVPPVNKRTRNKIKQELVVEDVTIVEESSSANYSDSRIKPNADEESAEFEKQPRKRGQKPASRARSETTQSKHNNKDVREKKKRAKIKSEAADDSSDQVEELESKVDVYQCQLCDGHTYGSPVELTAHLRAEHPDQIRTCDKCPKVFMNEATYQHHQYCHATLRSFFCMFCDKGFQTENLLK